MSCLRGSSPSVLLRYRFSSLRPLSYFPRITADTSSLVLFSHPNMAVQSLETLPMPCVLVLALISILCGPGQDLCTRLRIPDEHQRLAHQLRVLFHYRLFGGEHVDRTPADNQRALKPALARWAPGRSPQPRVARPGRPVMSCRSTAAADAGSTSSCHQARTG